jgi:hypothetical protein
VLKLLATLFALLDKALGLYHDKQLEEQGRQKVEEELNENVAKAEAAVVSPDPDRTERLRNRFDRSRTDPANK